MKNLRTLSVLCALALSPALHAATITIVNVDGPNEGFNDTTAVAPLPSNPGTTLGEQRLLVFETAAAQWAALLESDVEIRVRAAFNPLTCSGTSAVLGSAGALTIHRNFTNAPVANVWYAQALANSISGVDQDPGTEDITTQFNVSLDTGTCLTGNDGWYYSTEASDTTPSNRTPLLPVVFHELAHGLGFQTFTSSSTGAFNGGFPSIWDTFLTDAVTGTTWATMATNAERQASAISDPNLIWTGPIVTAEKDNFLGPAPRLIVNSPAAIAGSYAAQTASFGPGVPPGGITGNVVIATDTGGPLPMPNDLDGCEPLTNGAALAGNVALIVRGNCNFTVKVRNAQDAGAIAVLVDNNAAAGLPGMGGADPLVTILSYGISQADGNAIRTQLANPTAVNATLGFGTELSGTQTSMGMSFVRMNAPNPVQPGSSVSHWTVDAFPNLLMEPSLNTSLFSDVDLTIPLFRDIGWQVVNNDEVFRDGFE